MTTDPDALKFFSGSIRIDVLVAYTNTVDNRLLKNNTDIARHVDIAFTKTNLVNFNSGVKVRFYPISTVHLDLGESATMSGDLERFRLPNDGSIDWIHQIRDIQNADIAIMLTDSVEHKGDHTPQSPSGYCGMAPGICTPKEDSFAVVDFNCATNYYTLAHELGHIMGAHHNPETNPKLGVFHTAMA